MKRKTKGNPMVEPQNQPPFEPEADRPAAFPRDVAFLLGLAFLGMASLNLFSVYGRFSVLNAADTIGLILLFVLPFVAVDGALAFLFVRRRWTRGAGRLTRWLDSLVFLGLPMLGVAILSLAAVLWVNGGLDQDPEPLAQQATVKRLISIDKGENRVCAVAFDSPSAPPLRLFPQGTGGDEMLPINCPTLPFLHVGGTLLISTGHGALGVPWIKSYSISQGLIKAEGPKGMMNAFLWARLRLSVGASSALDIPHNF
jgi:hypothetical protein